MANRINRFPNYPFLLFETKDGQVNINIEKIESVAEVNGKDVVIETASNTYFVIDTFDMVMNNITRARKENT